ncbi:aldo/keto reductase [Ovoidimarina sediminis]|uniref:aldo/keto reductase n=1 Tax=Ovoidimarina sediminis TaxID=3079856 RepID=UPI0029153062|nr:aldo/keto reductase [Rhodophyticola sp. MJ-SS7]MDU8942136.1 aldo/keto reductase [Rhodophyticola sp. MJ-SS7]
MKRTTLGRTGIDVSAICLGTMTWGSQNTEAEGHAQIDAALDRGVDFMDTAEMYPVAPVLAETVGHTETIIGNWLARSGRRSDVVIATKVAGLNDRFVRMGKKVTPETLTEALEGSLRRLKTDYIDLYQLHWPNRGSYHFRQMWNFNPSTQDAAWEIENIHALTETLGDQVKAGKIRAWGLSNESAWGTMQWLKAAEATGGPRVATIQNEYSLLCRIYDTDLGELGAHEDVTLLAFSPLACGMLSGKYQNGQKPDGSRMTRTPDLGGRVTDRVFPAIEAYLDIARTHGLDPSAMAVAWTMTRPFPTIPIIGATSLEQLETVLDADEMNLSQTALEEIASAQKAHPNPF